MNYKWIHQRNNQDLILFFNGWGMDEHPVKHLNTGLYDVLMFYDYKNLALPEEMNIGKYKTIFVIAWSTGVWVASQVMPQFGASIHQTICINGTSQLIDDHHGIPETTFKGTLNGLNEQSLNKFYLRMCGVKVNYEFFIKHRPQRSLHNQRSELHWLYNQYFQSDQIAINASKVLIGKTDRIFPSQNQINHWQDTAKIKVMDWPHYPFAMYKSWHDIVEA